MSDDHIDHDHEPPQMRPTVRQKTRQLPRSFKLSIAYDSMYLVLFAVHLFGFHDRTILIWAGIPIAVQWVVTVVRWILTGTPVPRGWRKP
jgi:hypothetical protein